MYLYTHMYHHIITHRTSLTHLSYAYRTLSMYAYKILQHLIEKSTMSFKNVYAALLVVAFLCLGSIIFSRDALLAIRNSLPCDATVTPVGDIPHAVRSVKRNVPKFQVSSLYSEEHARIDNESAKIRCDRYGLKPLEDGVPPRRIFFGTMVADESWQVHVIHAIEVYGIYHVAVFAESNTTHVASPRPLRYKDSNEGDLLTQSGMFGPSTKVYIDYWLEDKPDLKWMNRESEQRNTIIRRWKDAGMTENDIGIMADADEFFSRDFLRAIQKCDVPTLRSEPSCHRPKVVALSISFEMSPYCIKKRNWFHPDAIRGECVEGIGDPTERIVPLRTHKRRYGERHNSYGKDDIDQYPEAIHASGRYPLFTGPDIRTVQGDWKIPYNVKDTTGDQETASYGAAYHLHNWFNDFSVTRNKYGTYAHGLRRKMKKPLSEVSDDLDLTVRCARGIDNFESKVPYYLNGKEIKGPRPIFFLNTTYLDDRHNLMLKLVREDEAKYGSRYDSNGNWSDPSLLASLIMADTDRVRSRIERRKKNKA